MHRGLSLVLCLAACGRIGFDDADPFAEISGLIVRYPMDDDPSRGVATASLPGYDGTCTVCPMSIAGHSGGGYAFGGAQWIALPTVADGLVGAQPYTVTVWTLAMTTAESKPTIVEKAFAPDDSYNVLKIYFDGGPVHPAYETYSAETGIDALDPTATSLANAWHALAAS